MPTYVVAEAETSELPKIVAEPGPKHPPVSPVKRSRIGDLPMRVIYRFLAATVAVVVAAVAAVIGFTSSGSSDRPGGEASGPIAAPSAATPPPGPSSSPEPLPASASSSASASASASPSAAPTASAAPATPPRSAAVLAALADPRVPELPGDKRLGRLPGKPHATKRRIRDTRSGVSLVRFGKPWKGYGTAPFATKQVLPKVRGAATRAMLVSCPVPINVQETVKDTALLAARWTLNHHPRGGKITWTASQPIKDGWVLAYQVGYKVKGKSRRSMAAVAVKEIPGAAKPALVFVTIPDAQRSRWRDINTAISSISTVKPE
ncbi:hypothetical protein [Streptosporangium pseudovulgare]|uniref:hypothetical protein n=1 Tax=Streptosporangium pseudovulgare TaxID=35765 RepID=UPI00166F91AA|nr:hypothetical protein [Streptosporangium pseudovulgare]